MYGFLFYIPSFAHCVLVKFFPLAYPIVLTVSMAYPIETVKTIGYANGKNVTKK